MPRRAHQYWLVPAFLALILVPTPIAMTVLAGGVLATVVARVTRAVAARRADAASAAAAAAILGTDTGGRTVLLTDHELSAHGLILGASGAGKSTTLLRVLTEQVVRGRPVLAIDLKGSPEFARVLAAAAAAAGRPFALWSLDGPSHWNPLQHGNATELKDKLISTERFSEPHYQRAAERYVQTVLRVLRAAEPDRPPVLAEVVKLMEPRRLPSVLRQVDPELRDRVLDYLAGLTPDQLSAVHGLQTRLAVLTESHVATYLAPPAGVVEGGGRMIDVREALRGRAQMIDVREALRGGEVVLFSLNSSTYGRLAAQIGTLVVQDLVSAAGHRLTETAGGAGAPRAIVGIDEFSALGADHVIALLARGRESGVSVLLATQEMTDLQRAAFGLRDQVLGVTAIKIAHRQEVHESALTIAQMAGTTEVWEHTRQTSARLMLGYDTGRGTKRLVERFVVPPNTIKTLPTGEAIVISKLRGGPPRHVRIDPPELER